MILMPVFVLIIFSSTMIIGFLISASVIFLLKSIENQALTGMLKSTFSYITSSKSIKNLEFMDQPEIDAQKHAKFLTQKSALIGKSLSNSLQNTLTFLPIFLIYTCILALIFYESFKSYNKWIWG